MRILAVEPGPHFSVSDVHNGWQTALANLGCQVQTYNLSNRLSFFGGAKWDDLDTGKEIRLSVADTVRLAVSDIKGKCYEWWPDVILVTSAFFVPPETYDLWKLRPHKVVLLLTESPYQDDMQIEVIERAEPDLVLLNDPINIDRYRSICKAVYFPHAYDPARHHPRRVRKDTDFTFIGTGYPSRTEFFEKIDWAGLDVKFGGNWAGISEQSPIVPHLIHEPDHCLLNDETVDLYHHTRVSANLYRGGDVREVERAGLEHGWAMGPREVELAATGTYFLREPRGEGNEILHMLPTFDGPAEFEDKLRWALNHPKERLAAIREARRAISDRTFDAHARHLLQLLG